MRNEDLILELLESISPEKYCDDCLSNELEIKPRQQVNQICRKIKKKNKNLDRKLGVCSSCKKLKIVNSLVQGYSNKTDIAYEVRENTDVLVFDRDTRIGSAVPDDRDYADLTETALPQIQHFESKEPFYKIQMIRREIVQICRSIWGKKIKEEMPKSVTYAINELRNLRVIPSHQANMMIMLCNLRNCFEYENLEFGENEKTIANDAWDIVQNWWDKTRNQFIS